MTADPSLDAVVVGSGPNGLAAAITFTRAGLAVRVYEAADAPGVGIRSEELTLPGLLHDSCTTVVATTLASPFRGSGLPVDGVAGGRTSRVS